MCRIVSRGLGSGGAMDSGSIIRRCEVENNGKEPGAIQNTYTSCMAIPNHYCLN